MNIKTIAIALFFATLSLSATANTADKAQQAIDNAQKLWDQSKTSGHEWNTVKPLVAQAKQALSAKDYDSAIKLANHGAKQAELSLIQAEHEKTNYLNSLIK